MRKLTETQRETIINECRVLPIREAYNKLALNVTRQRFYGILKYYKGPLCRVNHKKSFYKWFSEICIQRM